MFTAYLDPASSSAIIGAVAAGAAGAGVAAKTMLAKVRFRKPTGDDTVADETDLADATDDATS